MHEPDLPISGGEMGARIRAHDWSRTPLDSPETWPQSLRLALSICLQSSFPTAIYWGPELRLLYNDAWAPILAERHPWALGRPAHEVWADIWHVVGPQLARVVESGEGFSTYDQMLPMARSGMIEETYWNYSFTPIRGEDGRIVGVFNQGNETTDRVLGARRLKFRVDLEHRLQALANPVEIMSAAAELLGKHLNVGRVFYGEIDETAEHISVERDWTDGTMPSFVGRYRLDDFGKAVVDELRAGRSVRIDDTKTDARMGQRERTDAYGAAGFRAAFGVPLFKDGRLIAVLSAHSREPRRWTDADVALLGDIAERTWAAVERARAEALLRSSEQRLRVVTDNARVGLVVNGPDHRYRFANQAYADILDLPSAEIVGKRVAEVLAPVYENQIRPRLERAFAGETVAYELVRPGENGKDERRYAVTYEPGFEPDGTPVVIVVIFEITKRARAEEALRRLNMELEMRVEAAIAERTAALARLHEIQKLETIGQLTGGIAHDFNNLLTPVIGGLDLLRRRHEGDDRTQRLATNALEAAERAQTLVQRLLAFARRQELELRAVDVRALISGMTDLIARSIGPQIEIIIDAPADLPAVRSDAHQLELALLNLAVNARDAMSGKGALTIKARAERVGDGHETRLARGDYVCVSVIDTGVGMDAQTLRRAVEPFFSTKGVGQGTGLGLSMVHGLAGQSGGALALSSTPGRGTQVDLWLPTAGEKAETRREQARDTPIRTRNLSILLVDDEELVRTGTAHMLVDVGHTVTQAGSGARALELLRRGAAVDLVITDYLMPGMNGVELASAVRQLRPALPILLITGYANVTDNAESGGLPRLAKPFRAADLAHCIAELTSEAAETARVTSK